MLEEMKTWPEASPNPAVEISQEGLTNALMQASELHDQHAFDRKVIAWFHLAKLLACSGPRPKILQTKTYFFEVMRCNIYRDMINNIPDDWDTDEVPTESMRQLYREFLSWSAIRDNRKNKASDIKQITFEGRTTRIGFNNGNV